MAKKVYDVLSPDGFSIHPSDTYPTIKEAKQAFTEWMKHFKQQGYYSSVRHGRIDLADLINYCKFISIENPLEEELFGEVIERIKEDIAKNDVTAIWELLKECRTEKLIEFLPEAEWSKYDSINKWRKVQK